MDLAYRLSFLFSMTDKVIQAMSALNARLVLVCTLTRLTEQGFCIHNVQDKHCIF